jgi:acyl-CoA synthetase (AMP-forming)/AMP-acid ligase II
MYGDDIALIEREPEKNKRVEITWAKFHEQANAVAHGLIARGVGKGDKVVQLMMNCLEWLPVYFGILRTGAWAVPLNFRFQSKDISTCTQIAEAKVVLFGETFIDRIASVKKDLDRTVSHYIFVGPESLRPPFAESFASFVSSSEKQDVAVDIDLQDPAALYFTSGTTGTPKPALLTHRNLEFACFLENRHHHQTRSDNFLCIPPLYHTGAKMHWFGNFVVGAKAVIIKGVSPQWILEAISEEGVTIVWLLVPWALDILFALENKDVRIDDYNLDTWRLMHMGAQPIPPSLVKEWKKWFPHHAYDTNYGLTESTGPGCVHLGMGHLSKVGAIGRPGFDWECKIVDQEHGVVPFGNPGELWVKGPGVMKEYYKNPEATAQTLFDGWLATGDIVKQDEDGYIWLVDRKKDVIITGGENIYPVEIENFLQTHSDIQDVAVIGLPSTRLGEIVTAIIQVKEGKTLTPEAVAQYCEQLPRYKRPRRVFFGAVPRNPTGKIEKPKLRKQYGGIETAFDLGSPGK